MRRTDAGDGRQVSRFVVDIITGLIAGGGGAGIGGVAIGGIVIFLRSRSNQQGTAGGHRAPQQHFARRLQTQESLSTTDLRRDAIAGKSHPRAHR